MREIDQDRAKILRSAVEALGRRSPAAIDWTAWGGRGSPAGIAPASSRCYVLFAMQSKKPRFVDWLLVVIL
jgi:hypothetical protein